MKTIMSKIDLLFPDPFFEHQIMSWKESKQDSFFKTLMSYFRKELAFKNISDSYREIRDCHREYIKGKKGWERFKAEFLP